MSKNKKMTATTGINNSQERYRDAFSEEAWKKELETLQAHYILLERTLADVYSYLSNVDKNHITEHLKKIKTSIIEKIMPVPDALKKLYNDGHDADKKNSKMRHLTSHAAACEHIELQVKRIFQSAVTGLELNGTGSNKPFIACKAGSLGEKMTAYPEKFISACSNAIKEMEKEISSQVKKNPEHKPSLETLNKHEKLSSAISTVDRSTKGFFARHSTAFALGVVVGLLVGCVVMAASHGAALPLLVAGASLAGFGLTVGRSIASEQLQKSADIQKISSIFASPSKAPGGKTKGISKAHVDDKKVVRDAITEITSVPACAK